jgi:hypothetical protein
LEVGAEGLFDEKIVNCKTDPSQKNQTEDNFRQAAFNNFDDYKQEYESDDYDDS